MSYIRSSEIFRYPKIISQLRQHFDDQAIVELAALIAYQNMSGKFNAALGIPAHGFCDFNGHEDLNSLRKWAGRKGTLGPEPVLREGP